MTTESSTEKPAKKDSKSINPQQSLPEEIRFLTTELEKKNHFLRRFFMSVVTGAGTIIGATIIAGIVIILVLNVIEGIESAKDIPFLEQLYDFLTSSANL